MAAIVLNNSGLRKGHCSPEQSRSQWQVSGYTGDMVVVSPPTGVLTIIDTPDSVA
jgi:hypothetical protein